MYMTGITYFASLAEAKISQPINHSNYVIEEQVKSACRVLLAELVKLQDAPLGFAGGMEMGTAYVGSMAWRKATALLGPLRHPDGFGIA